MTDIDNYDPPIYCMQVCQCLTLLEKAITELESVKLKIHLLSSIDVKLGLVMHMSHDMKNLSEIILNIFISVENSVRLKI